MASNTARLFSEVLSLDAWHDAIQAGGNSAAVYVELSFHEGRLGGKDADFPFTFKVNLKRALVTVRLEHPLELERRSIARSIPETEVELVRLRAAKESAVTRAGGSARLTPAAMHLALHAETAADKTVSAQDELRVVQTLPETLVSPRPIDQRSYSWEVEPTYRPFLRGQPWHPIESPRLSAVPPAQPSPIMPAMTVDVSCSLDDVDISDLTPKKESLLAKLSGIGEVNKAAAIHHLKRVLSDAELHPGQLDNRFSDLLLASVIAIPGR